MQYALTLPLLSFDPFAMTKFDISSLYEGNRPQLVLNLRFMIDSRFEKVNIDISLLAGWVSSALMDSVL